MEIGGELSEEFNLLLPKEILILIYEYLPLNDIKSASLVSKHWYEAYLHSSVTRRRIITIKKNRLKNGVSYTEILDSNILYSNLKIGKYSYCLLHNSFWRTISENLRFLELSLESFQNCSDFLFNLKFLVNLKTLHLFIEEFDNDMQITSQDVFELKNLNNLRYHSELKNDSMLKQVLSVMPNIVHWDFLYHQPSNQTIHETTILNYVTNGKDRIETLVLESNLTTIKNILNLTEMNLTTLSLGISDLYWTDLNETDDRSLYSQIESFTNDTKLLSIKLSNLSLFDIIDKKFTNLEEIYLEIECSVQVIAKKLEKFTKFESIHLYKDNEFYINWDVDITDTFKETKKNLKKLILFSGYDPDRLLMNSVSDLTCFKNLTRLILEDCGFNQEQEEQYELFKTIFNMKQLKYLYINDNLIESDATSDNEYFEEPREISDWLFSGVEQDEYGNKSLTGFSIADLVNLVELHVNIRKSNLGDETLLEISKLPKLQSLSIKCGLVSIDSSRFKEMTNGRVNAIIQTGEMVNWRPIAEKPWRSKYFNIRYNK